MLQNVSAFLAYRTFGIDTDQRIGGRIPDIAGFGGVIPADGKTIYTTGFWSAHKVSFNFLVIHNAALPATTDTIATAAGEWVSASGTRHILPAATIHSGAQRDFTGGHTAV